MDIEFDSDLDKLKEVEIIGHAGGTFQPYFYKPVRRNQPESSFNNELTQTSPSSFRVPRILTMLYQMFLFGEKICPSFLFV